MRSLTETLENKTYGSSDKEIVRMYVAQRVPERAEREFQQTYFTDENFEDDKGNWFTVFATLWYYEEWNALEGWTKKVIEYSAVTMGDHEMTKESFNESLRESIRFHVGNDVVFEVSEPKEI